MSKTATSCVYQIDPADHLKGTLVFFSKDSERLGEVPCTIENEKGCPWPIESIAAPKVQNELVGFFNAFVFTHLTIISFFWFMPIGHPKNPKGLFGFSVGLAKLTDRYNGKEVPGFFFCRGDAVASQIIVNITDAEPEEEKSYYLLCRQARACTGGYITELVAGMVDNATGNYRGPMINEVKEETGLDINTRRRAMLEIGNAYPSPGGCDERITFYHIEIDITKAELKAMMKQVHGVGTEAICIEVVPESEYHLRVLASEDMKAMTACFLYYVRKNYSSEQIAEARAKYGGKHPMKLEFSVPERKDLVTEL